jgi:hypothetical protein
MNIFGGLISLHKQIITMYFLSKLVNNINLDQTLDKMIFSSEISRYFVKTKNSGEYIDPNMFYTFIEIIFRHFVIKTYQVIYLTFNVKHKLTLFDLIPNLFCLISTSNIVNGELSLNGTNFQIFYFILFNRKRYSK